MILTPAHLRQLSDLRASLDAAGHGERTRIIREFAGRAGLSVGTIYRLLARAGHLSGRKRRWDKGMSAVSRAYVAASRRLAARDNSPQPAPAGTGHLLMARLLKDRREQRMQESTMAPQKHEGIA